MSRRPLLATVTALSLVLGSVTLGVQSATADPGDGTSGPHAAEPGLIDPAARPATRPTLGGGLDGATGTVTALVELDTPSGADVTADGGTPADVQAAAEDTTALAEQVVPSRLAARTARAATPQRIATLTTLVSGTLVTGDAAQVRALAGRDGVVGVYRVTPKTPTNADTVAFTHALQVWQDTGQTGAGVRIGVIDTGLDYTHADFGGPGTPEAYAQAYGEDGSGPVPDGLFDPTKFIGGYDFAGPFYDADPATTLPGATPVPTPDENPIDATYLSPNSGHGTHVSGTAAGYGVLPDGTTFRGDYSGLSDVSDWQVGPGSAPGAQIFALKVFGDVGGSSDLTSLALDRAADPNGDGDLSDRLDVVNLSLGGDGAPADDPDNLLVQRLVDLGTVVVTSAGNAGDLTDIGGSPGNSPAALTVANSVGSPQRFDGVEVTAAADPALVRTWSAQNSVAYAGPDVTAPVAFLGETFDGCTPFTPEQAAAVAGKVAYLWWDDDDSTRGCGSAARFDTAAAAGAAGVLLSSTLPVFAAGIAGNEAIPGAQLTGPSTTALLPEITAGTLTVHLGPSLAGAVTEDFAADVLNPGSSRGEHGSLGGAGKPDVAAPGTMILSAASGSGNEPQALTGTSMSSPHVAGITALVRSAHPSWSPAQVKAAVVNTATHDVTTGANGTGLVYGPARVGSGRVDAAAAVAADVLAYDAANPQQTSVEFGVVPVGDRTVKRTAKVTVTNLGDTRQRFTTAVTSSTTAGGATITASPSTLTLPPGASKTVTLTLRADPATLSRDLDPTSAAVQAGVPREYVAEVSGRLVLTSADRELRVPVRAAPRLVADLTARDVTFPDPVADVAGLALRGRGVASGGWYSLTTPLVLGTESPRLADSPGLVTSPSARAQGDLRYVGWASTAPAVAAAGGDPTDGQLAIGIATDGDWAVLGRAMQPVVEIDVDGDGTSDLQTVVDKLDDFSDVTVAATFDNVSGALVGLELVNAFAGDVEAGVFDDNVLVIPVDLTDTGIPVGATPTVQVWTHSDYAEDPSGVLDVADPFTVDPYDPPFWFENDIAGSFSTLGDGGTTIPVHRRADVTDGRLLVLQHQNAETGTRAEVVSVGVPAPTATSVRLSVSGASTAGQQLTLTATVSPRQVTGTVRFLDGDDELATAAVSRGAARATVRLGAGTHELRAELVPSSPQYAGSMSDVVRTTLKKSGSSTALALSRNAGPYGSAVTATVTVTGSTTAPEGTVEIRERGQVLASGTVTVSGRKGTATIALPRDLRVGTHQLTAVYLGNDDVSGSQSQRSYRVTQNVSSASLSTATWTVHRGDTPQVTVEVSGPHGAPSPTGTVVVLVNLRALSPVTLQDGRATVTLPRATSTAVVTALYAGDRGYLPSVAAHVLTVRR